MNNVLRYFIIRQIGLRKISVKMPDEPVVTVQEGRLRGKCAADHYGGKYFCFQGIPYAKPPLGELRFKAPQPPEPWPNTRDATVEGDSCYGFLPVKQRICGSENCLFLNVYTPRLPKQNTTLKPVMVWFHGGSFISGSGSKDSYGPDFLMPHDVIVVTVNFRFGLLGFLNFDDPSLGVPGNAGLKDQVLALKWVQKNIENFSGDPNNVTIFGESSGGASVHYLMLSPLAEGLFHKAIIQSGSVLCCWAQGQPSAPLISKVLNLPNSSELEMLEVLQRMSVEELYQLQNKLPDESVPSIRRSLGPVVEKPSNEPGFLLEEPIDLVMSGRYNKVPLIIGYTSREGMMASLVTKMKYGAVKLIQDFERMVPFVLKLEKGSNDSKKAAQKMKTFYYGAEEPSMENIDQYYLINTDISFLRGIHISIKHQVASSEIPIYYYRMSVESKLNKYRALGKIQDSGVCHGDDLGYLFKTGSTPNIRPNSIEDIGMRRFTKLWTTFARYGNPNPIEKDNLINVTWKPVEKGQHNFLDIGENLTLGVNPEEERMRLWDQIYGLNSCGSNY